MAGESPSGQSETDHIVDWVVHASHSDIPNEVRERVCWLILDHVACAIGGSTLRPGSILIDLFRDLGGVPQATVYATLERTTLLNATYLNCTLSNLLDMDDTYTNTGHPGATAVSPALAIAEYLGRAGEDVITAVAIGYEVMLRLGLATLPTPSRHSKVHGFGTFQTLGAVVTAGRLLELSVDQFHHAFGLGLTNAPVPNMRKLGLEPEERPLAWLKNNYGWAAQGGLLGALLAQRGMQGNRRILEGDRGFWIMAGSDRYDPTVITTNLGNEWLLLKTGFKPYASCRWTHTAIDSVRDLMRAHPTLEIVEMSRIQLRTFVEVAENLGSIDPTDIIDAQFSVRHLMALEFLGRSSANGLREDDLACPNVVALRRRIEVIEDETLTARYVRERTMPAELSVETKDRRHYSIQINEPWGDPGRPLEKHDLLMKYDALTLPTMGKEISDQLREHILGLDSRKTLSLFERFVR